ncbi:MAG TPA: DUF4136 domain-containing protein [Terriglobia bacterium]|nr:DUF4136 domain-containing protein [Terriglobia bacterium]
MSTRKSVQIAMGLFVALLFCGLGLAQQTTFNYMPGTNFSQFHTFKWVTIPGGVHPDQIVDQEIHNAVASQLTGKGLTETSADNADLYVGYQAAVDQEKQWNAMGTGGWRLGGGMGSATSSTITNGTLVVDVYNPADKQLVWSGRVSKTLSPSKNQQKNMENLNKAIAKLMKNYPPPQK